MDARLVNIDREHAAYFAFLDPFGRLEEELGPQIRLIGAVVRQEDEDLPCGLMILEEKPGELVIRWLYVSPEYRCQRIGCRLLELAYEAACAKRLPELTAVVEQDYLDRKIGWQPIHYLKECFFKEHRPKDVCREPVMMTASTAFYREEKDLFLQRLQK